MTDTLPIVQEAVWAQGRAGGAENLFPTRIRSRIFQPAVSRYTDKPKQRASYFSSKSLFYFFNICIDYFESLASSCCGGVCVCVFVCVCGVVVCVCVGCGGV